MTPACKLHLSIWLCGGPGGACSMPVIHHTGCKLLHLSCLIMPPCAGGPGGAHPHSLQSTWMLGIPVMTCTCLQPSHHSCSAGGPGGAHPRAGGQPGRTGGHRGQPGQRGRGASNVGASCVGAACACLIGKKRYARLSTHLPDCPAVPLRWRRRRACAWHPTQPWTGRADQLRRWLAAWLAPAAACSVRAPTLSERDGMG